MAAFLIGQPDPNFAASDEFRPFGYFLTRSSSLTPRFSGDPAKRGRRLEPVVSCHWRHKYLPARLNVATEVVENGLPPFALLLDRMS